MHNVQINGLQYFVIIADRKKKKKFLTLLDEHGARGIEVIYAHGSMSTNSFAAAFGFETKQNKVMLACLLKDEKAKELTQLLYKKYKFNKPNTGIAYSVSVEGLAF